jgi:hypothetical protein
MLTHGQVAYAGCLTLWRKSAAPCRASRSRCVCKTGPSAEVAALGEHRDSERGPASFSFD